VYFQHNGQLWQTDGDTAGEVLSIDPGDSTIDYPFSLMAIPGKGIVFSDGDHLWFANRDGARALVNGYIAPYADYMAMIGDSIVFASQESGGTKLRRVNVDQSGSAVTQVVTSDTNIIRQVAPFAGGVVYAAILAGSPTSYVLKWVDPSAGVPVTLATSQTPFSGFPQSPFSDFVTTAASGGSENLFFFEKTSTGAQLRLVNSAELQSPSPQITTLATYGSGVSVGSLGSPSQPTRAAGSTVIFSTATNVSGSNQFQFWISDGTVAGTVTVGPLFQGGSIAEHTSFEGDVYFVHRPQNSSVDQSTLVAQIWKVDPGAQQLTSVATYFGSSYLSYRPQYFVAAGDTLYFQAWDTSAQEERLWSLTAETAPAPVPAQANNPYAEPALWDTAYVNGELYFNARSDAVVDRYGYGTYQLWVVGPAYATPPELPGDYNQDATVGAADYVLWRKLLGTTGVPAFSGPDGNGNTIIDQGDYAVWTANFGKTLPLPAAGSGAELNDFARAAFDIVGEADTPVHSETSWTSAPTKLRAVHEAGSTRLEPRAVRQASANRQRMGFDVPPAAEPVTDNLLLMLAIDQLLCDSRQGATVNDDHMFADQYADEVESDILSHERLAGSHKRFEPTLTSGWDSCRRTAAMGDFFG
jgi:hypothetical protein